MNQDEYILKTITGERDDLLEILSQKDEMISLMEGALDKISNLTECGISENIADETIAKLNEMRRE